VLPWSDGEQKMVTVVDQKEKKLLPVKKTSSRKKNFF
jgi:hypothetical protein